MQPVGECQVEARRRAARMELPPPGETAVVGDQDGSLIRLRGPVLYPSGPESGPATSRIHERDAGVRGEIAQRMPRHAIRGPEDGGRA